MKRLSIFIIVLIAGILVFSFTKGKHEQIKDGHAGIVIGPGNKYKIYMTGENPFVIPFVQKLYLVSLSNQDYILSGTDGYRLSADGKTLTIESRVIYTISDINRAVETFGYQNTHEEIRNILKEAINKLLAEKVKDKSYLDSPQKRIPIIAEIHLGLNDTFSTKGIDVLSYQIRYE